MGAAGTIQSSQQQARAMEHNAFLAEQDAITLKKQEGYQLHALKTKYRDILAKQVAFAAASGRSLSGSPLDVIARSEADALIEQGILKSNTIMGVTKFQSEALMSRTQATSTKASGYIQSFSGLLSSDFARSNYFKSSKKGK